MDWRTSHQKIDSRSHWKWRYLYMTETTSITINSLTFDKMKEKSYVEGHLFDFSHNLLHMSVTVAQYRDKIGYVIGNKV